jgi:hypothetical protein
MFVLHAIERRRGRSDPHRNPNNNGRDGTDLWVKGIGTMAAEMGYVVRAYLERRREA